MTVRPLDGPPQPAFLPDTASVDAAAAPDAAPPFARALADAYGTLERAFVRADGAERAFAAGRGGLQEMVLQRAQADVALSVATAAASRTSQALTTILGMQV